jgi:hypothetical protein
MEVRGQFHAPDALNPEKEPPVPIVKEAVWAQWPVWMLWREENLLSLSAIEPKMTDRKI